MVKQAVDEVQIRAGDNDVGCGAGEKVSCEVNANVGCKKSCVDGDVCIVDKDRKGPVSEDDCVFSGVEVEYSGAIRQARVDRRQQHKVRSASLQSGFLAWHALELIR